jgi:hypothetical protein
VCELEHRYTFVFNLFVCSGYKADVASQTSFWSGNLGRSLSDSHVFNRKGGRTLTDKIGVGAGTDIVFPTSKTPVCRTHRPTKSLSAPARRSVS